jgi:hypothetical protein
MNFLFAMASRAGALVLCLALAACSTMAHSYMSPDQRQAHGRQLLQEAVQQSDVVSILVWGGVVVVESDFQLDHNQYCSVSLAIWISQSHREGWSDSNRDGDAAPTCKSYHGIVDVRPSDMRNCQGGECLWLRGL